MPKLKAVLEKKEEIPSGLEDFYEEKDGKFHLQAEGFTSETEANKLRTTLERVKKEKADAIKALEPFKNADGTPMKPEDVHAAMDELEELRAKAERDPKDKDAFEKEVAARVTRETAPLKRDLKKSQDDLKAATDKLAGKETELNRLSLRDVLNPILAKSGMNSAAHEEVLDLAERVFDRTEDGKWLTKSGGKFPEAMSPDVWVKEPLKEQRPYLWPTSQGGGAGGGGGGGGAGGENPWTHEHWNATKQGEIIKADRAKAERMAASAGTTINGNRPAKKVAV